MTTLQKLPKFFLKERKKKGMHEIRRQGLKSNNKNRHKTQDNAQNRQHWWQLSNTKYVELFQKWFRYYIVTEQPKIYYHSSKFITLLKRSNTSKGHWSKENKWRPFKFLKGTSYGKWHAGSDEFYNYKKQWMILAIILYTAHLVNKIILKNLREVNC